MTPEARVPRIHFIDVLRLLALAQMVNGHTLHAVLDDSVRHGAFYERYLWFRGLVSVAFMLVAGLAFHVTTLARFDAYRSDRMAQRRRVRRAFEIIGLGLLLKFPLLRLFALDLPGVAAGVLNLSHIDVLPCIGVSLLALEGLTRMSSKAAGVVLGSALLCAFAAIAAPWGAMLPAAGPSALLVGWLGPQTGSQFPLLPWSGFVFAGVVIGAFALPQGARTPWRTAVARLAASALALFAVALLLGKLPWSLPQAAGVAAPAFLAQKLAAVVLAVAALAFALRRVRELPGFLRVLAGETLAVYVFHLTLLYGFPYNLHGRIGSTLSLVPALALSVLMLGASTAFGLCWHELKRLLAARRLTWNPRAAAVGMSLVLFALLLAVTSRVLAEGPTNTNGTPYAIGGYDPVAYVQDGKAVPGDPKLSASYRGAKWLFASAEHLKAWSGAPERFAPAYGGHCAYAAAQKRLVRIDPQAFSVVGGRLFLNYSLDIRAKWNADRARLIRDADAFWSGLAMAK